MTDKLDPGWVNDRLPTKEDGNTVGEVWDIDNEGRIWWEDFKNISKGQQWSKISRKKNGDSYDRDEIATPQECLDREKEAKDKKIINEGYFEFNNAHLVELDDDLKRTRKALAKSEERVKEFQQRQEEDGEVLCEQIQITSESHEKADKLLKQNELLKKLLIKEWGG